MVTCEHHLRVKVTVTINLFLYFSKIETVKMVDFFLNKKTPFLVLRSFTSRPLRCRPALWNAHTKTRTIMYSFKLYSAFYCHFRFCFHTDIYADHANGATTENDRSSGTHIINSLPCAKYQTPNTEFRWDNQQPMCVRCTNQQHRVNCPIN